MQDGDDYFDHAGALAADDLHPFGEAATTLLLSALTARRGRRFLELGCGTGKTLARLGAQERIELVGIDRSLAMLRTARVRMRWSRLSTQPRLVRADASRLPFADALFDGVYAESVVAFQPDSELRAIVSQARRVLRSGGLLVLNESIWRCGTTDEEAARAHDAAAATFGVCQSSRRARTIDGWRELLEAGGFERLSDDPLEELVFSVPEGRTEVPLATRLALASRRLRHALQPEVRRKRRRYRRAEASIRHFGSAIEARLFVFSRRGK